MRLLFLIAIMAFGITTAQAQTSSTTAVGSDPLSVPTKILPTGSETATGALGTGGTATGSNATSGISAPSSNPSQVPLQLPGEAPDRSAQSAATTAGASSHTAAPICPPPVPTSDGGSANLTEMVGGSLNGC